jgi:oligoendopeptidase F
VTTQTFSAAGIRWDLGDLFASHEDPRIEATLRGCHERARAFAEAHRGTIAIAGGPPPARLLAAIRELEALHTDLSRVGAFADLLYAGDTSQPEVRDLEEKVELSTTEIGNLLLFFELEWMDLPDDAAERLLAHPTLAGYRHYLLRLRQYRPHRSEAPPKMRKSCKRNEKELAARFGNSQRARRARGFSLAERALVRG